MSWSKLDGQNPVIWSLCQDNRDMDADSGCIDYPDTTVESKQCLFPRGNPNATPD